MRAAPARSVVTPAGTEALEPASNDAEPVRSRRSPNSSSPVPMMPSGPADGERTNAGSTLILPAPVKPPSIFEKVTVGVPLPEALKDAPALFHRMQFDNFGCRPELL